MKLQVRRNYGGELLELVFKETTSKEEEALIKFNGFIETNSLRIQHITTVPKKSKDKVLLLLPNTIPPTYECRDARIWYECVVITNPDHVFVFPITIHNNNLECYTIEGLSVLEFGGVDNSEYISKKAKLASVIAKYEDLDISEKTPSFLEYQKLAASNFMSSLASSDPIFPSPNALKASREPFKFVICNGKEKIAQIEFPPLLTTVIDCHIHYFSNVNVTEIVIYRDYYENEKHLDRSIVQNIKEISESYLERYFQLVVDGCTLKTNIFKVEYTLEVDFDGFVITKKIGIVSNSTKVYYS